MNRGEYDVRLFWAGLRLINETAREIAQLPESGQRHVRADAARELGALAQKLEACLGDSERQGRPPAAADCLIGKLLLGAAGAYGALLLPPSPSCTQLAAPSDRRTDLREVRDAIRQVVESARRDNR